MKRKIIATILSTVLAAAAAPIGCVSAAAESTALPSSVDLRNFNGKNYVPPVKQQEPFGTCWAFGTAEAAEISYLYANDLGVPAGEANNTVDFSEKYIAWYVYHPFTSDDVTAGRVRASQVGEGIDPARGESSNPNAVYDFGGASYMGMSLFAAGFNPVDESVTVNGETPYYYSGKNQIRSSSGRGYSSSDDWSLPLNREYLCAPSAAYFKNGYDLPVPSGRAEDGSYEFDEEGLNAVKAELAEGHGVAMSMSITDGFNYNNWAQYTAKITESTHEVTIVGYDDNYSKDNFTRYTAAGRPRKNSTPPGDGAFIVKNHNGGLTDEDRATAVTDEHGRTIYQNPNANKFGVDESGYFYLSYYDQSIDSAVSFDFEKDEDVKYSSRNYDQYDLLMSGWYASEEYSDETKMANVFDAEENEYLYKISYKTNDTDVKVHYEIYKDIKNGNPASGTLLEKGDASHKYAGFYTLDLSGEYFLKKGEKYSVVLTMTHKDSEGNTNYTDVFAAGANRKAAYVTNGVINAGESYLYSGGKWTDMNEIKESLIDKTYEKCLNDDGIAKLINKFNDDGRNGFSIDNYPIKAILVPAEERDANVIFGDVNNDKKSDITDATLIQMHAAKIAPLGDEAAKAADVDSNGKIDITDATLVQMKAAGLKTEF